MTLTDAELLRADLPASASPPPSFAARRRRPSPEAAYDELAAPCDGCGRKLPVVAGIILLETEDSEPEDFAFCSIGCMVVLVRRRWIER